MTAVLGSHRFAGGTLALPACPYLGGTAQLTPGPQWTAHRVQPLVIPVSSGPSSFLPAQNKGGDFCLSSKNMYLENLQLAFALSGTDINFLGPLAVLTMKDSVFQGAGSHPWDCLNSRLVFL